MPDGASAIPKVGCLGTLHMVCITGPIAVPLSAEVTAANIQDSQAYGILASSLPVETIRKAHFMAADPGYDDQSLHELSRSLGFHLVCPVRRHRSTPQERLEMAGFHESALGQVVYSRRGTHP